MGKTTKLRLSSARAGRAVRRLARFAVEVPSWGFADTGTRFGKFAQDAAAIDLGDKLADAGAVHAHTGITPTVAVHVLWDFPDGFDPGVVKLARKHGVRIGSINPNVFQDQCYKHGSICNRDAKIRRRAVRHMLESVQIGRAINSRYLSLWFADGANYPGQADIRQRKAWATAALKKVHAAMPSKMTMLVEYKPFEPCTYFTDFFDWGSSYIFARSAGQIVLAVVLFLIYGGLLLGVLPSNPGISWQAHLCGAIGGILAARITVAADRRRTPPGTPAVP